jgi:hypothetical protein
VSGQIGHRQDKRKHAALPGLLSSEIIVSMPLANSIASASPVPVPP